MRRASIACAMTALLAACSSGGSAVSQLAAHQAWSRPTPSGATNGVVYLTVESPIADAIVSASVPSSVADGAELHETMTTGGTSPMANMPQMAGDGTMTMTPVASVPVPANGTVVFAPGGLHIMLTHLRQPLVTGAHFTLTLHLGSGSDLPVDVVVGNEPPAS